MDSSISQKDQFWFLRVCLHFPIQLYHLFVHSFTISFKAPTLHNVRTFQVAILISLILYPCPGRFHFSWLFRDHHLGFLTAFLRWQVVGLSPNANVEGQLIVFITPWAGWHSYTPRHRVPILVAFYDVHGLQWDFLFSVTTLRIWSHANKCILNLNNKSPAKWTRSLLTRVGVESISTTVVISWHMPIPLNRQQRLQS